MCLETEQLKNLEALDGKTLGDHLALTIGTVGENASLRRAFCFKGDTGVKITGREQDYLKICTLFCIFYQ